jgi:hypothetical protein
VIGNSLRKTIRILGIFLVLAALLIFVTGVVSDWNHRVSTKDANCPYCHLSHHTTVRLQAAPSLLQSKIATALCLLQDSRLTPVLAFTQIAPRAPPAA